MNTLVKTNKKFPDEKIKNKKGAETNTVTTNGQLNRPKKKVKESNVWYAPRSRFVETKSDAQGDRRVKVIIIQEGLGNLRDKHFYTKEALQKCFQRFEGQQCYADHPSKSEELDRPERSTRDIIGHYENVTFIENFSKGVSAIQGDLCILPGAAYDWAWNLVQGAVQYARKYPDMNLVGISINANGVTHPENENNAVIHYVDEIPDVFSADLVTKAGAGGKILEGFKESMKRLKEAISKLPNKGVKTTMKKEMEKMIGEMEALKGKCESGEVEPATMPDVIGNMIDMLKGLADKVPADADADADADTEADAKAKADADAKAKADADAKAKADAKPADAPADGEEAKTIKEAQAVIEKMKADMKLKDAEIKESKDKLAVADAEKKLTESKMLVATLLEKSHLPKGTFDDLKEVLIGKDEKYCQKMIEGRKEMLKNLNKVVVEGIGEIHLSESNSKVDDILAGIPTK